MFIFIFFRQLSLAIPNRKMGKSKKASKGQWPSMVKRMRWDSKVYAGNLGKRATKAELKEAFAKYGPVKAIFVQKPSDGKRGCAFSKWFSQPALKK